jgi:Pentapeptide repeats (8 copies)
MAMSSIVELPLKARAAPPTGRRQGLRKLSPDLISKARDETATQVTRIGLTFLGTTAFCLLSLFTPDSALLGGSEKINVPLAGPVSFFGFMLLGPAFLIVQRVYLQIYVEHSERLDRFARSMSAPRAPNLVPVKNWLLRLFSGAIFYLLLPVTMMFFAWKAAVFPTWGLGLLCVALGVIASHAMLWLNRFCWLWPLPLKVLTSATVCAVFVVLSVVFNLLTMPENARFLSSLSSDFDYFPGEYLVRRPFNLERAHLPGLWLPKSDLRGANLMWAKLSNAELSIADLNGAVLVDADPGLFNALY